MRDRGAADARQPQFDLVLLRRDVGIKPAAGRVAALFRIVADRVPPLGGPSAPVEILPQDIAEGDVAVVQHMLGAQHGGAGDEAVALVRGHALVVDIEQILPPRILVQLEELRIAEQAEAVHHLPFDAVLAGGERLRRGRRRSEQGGERRGEDEEKRHGTGFIGRKRAKLGQPSSPALSANLFA